MIQKRTTVRLNATQATGRPITWAQIEMRAVEGLQELLRNHPKAAELMLCLIRHMQPGSGGVVVVSRETMRGLLDCSMPTIARALKVLIDDGWVQRLRIGSAHALAINERIAWVGPRGDKQHAVFSATVIASRAEQDDMALNPPPARTVPVIDHGEIPALTGPGLPPPSQPSLSGLEPVLYRDPDSGVLFDLDPRTGELQQRLAVEPVEPVEPEAPQNRPLPQRITSLLAAGPDDLTTWEKGFLSNLLAALDAGKTLTAKQAEKAGAILDRLGAAP